MASIIGQGKAYCKQAQQIVLNVYSYLIENPTQGTTPMHETVTATGVSKSSICKIQKDGITGQADYYDEMDRDTFLKWFRDQLIPNIPHNSVIIMDNASYHSMRSEKAPMLSTRKYNMQKWLADHKA